jgi:conjugative transfer region protein TrbK
MDGKTLARLGAVVFVGVAIAATAVDLKRNDDEPQVQIVGPVRQGEVAAHRQILRRCRDMGEAATRDPACLKVWADNRDRFLGQDAAQSSTSIPVAPATLFPSEPAHADRVRSDLAEPARPEVR